MTVILTTQNIGGMSAQFLQRLCIDKQETGGKTTSARENSTPYTKMQRPEQSSDIHRIQKTVPGSVGANLLHKDGCTDLTGLFDLFPKQQRAAAYKNNLAGTQLDLPLPQSTEKVRHEGLRAALYQCLDLTAVLCTATCENGVNVRFLQQQIMVGTNLGQQSVIECNVMRYTSKPITDCTTALSISSLVR